MVYWPSTQWDPHLRSKTPRIHYLRLSEAQILKILHFQNTECSIINNPTSVSHANTFSTQHNRTGAIRRPCTQHQQSSDDDGWCGASCPWMSGSAELRLVLYYCIYIGNLDLTCIRSLTSSLLQTGHPSWFLRIWCFQFLNFQNDVGWPPVECS